MTCFAIRMESKGGNLSMKQIPFDRHALDSNRTLTHCPRGGREKSTCFLHPHPILIPAGKRLCTFCFEPVPPRSFLFPKKPEQQQVLAVPLRDLHIGDLHICKFAFRKGKDSSF
ncbi:hypothetical protein CDAR_517511 [Caerostris darwini]|uniref:Uncharacterized protein n=1 Tax=Caerostris darwini TaxID=1538125 RepID=A0AAV4PMZ0_9ARAC|nr:hypothetical protein CDAR_517511 [Caerostris darwini]